MLYLNYRWSFLLVN